MKILFKILPIVLFLSISSCIGQKNKADIIIPDKVDVKPNSGQTQMYGTHVYIRIPDGFSFNSNTNRYEKEDLAYFKVVENTDVGFDDYYKRYNDAISIEESNNKIKIHYKKDFNLQNNKAVFVCAQDIGDNETEQLILIFGDIKNSIMLIGRYRLKEKRNRDIIINSFLSAYTNYDAPTELNDIQKFTINLLDSRFKYNSYGLGTFIYTIDGKGDAIGKMMESIVIAQSEPLNNNLIKEKALSIIENYKKYGIEIIDYTDKSKIINNLYAYEVISNAVYENDFYTIYTIITSNKNNSIIFTGTAKEKNKSYLDQFEKIAETIKIK